MAGKFKRLGRKLFIISNIVIVFFYLLACLVPFLDTGKFWFIGLLGLIFPFLLFILIGSTIICLLIKSKWFYASLAALLLSWQQVSVLFSFHLPHKFNSEKPGRTLRVLSWNIFRWDETNRKNRIVPYRELMMDLIQQQNADIICLQEFFECRDPKFFQENISPVKKLGYPYYYFFPSFSRFEGKFEIGLFIASKYPIIDTAKFNNNAGEHSEGFCYADIKVQNQIFRIFTTHLESAGFDKQDYEKIGTLTGSRTIIGKIKRSYRLRNEQAKTVKAEIKKSPYPAIVCADLDDVPNSYAYFTVKGNLQDVFLKKGSGIGRTYQFISPTLRIDDIFADRKLKIEQFARLKVPYSDHYPLIVDFSLKEE